MRILDFDPKEGQAFQGDVAIIPIPSDIAIGRGDEMLPVHGKLILQEGEMTGHHHHIVIERPAKESEESPAEPESRKRTMKGVEGLMSDALAGKIAVPTARMFRDAAVAIEMQRRGILTRSDLAVACLVVENGPMVVSHQEHDGIRLPVGSYLIGRQIESAGQEERIVAD
jgi:hypothetical protein